MSTVPKQPADLAGLILDLVPKAPPCFADWPRWVAFLQSAAQGQNNPGAQKVLIVSADKPVRFNYNFDWCTGCIEDYRAQMKRQGRCNPNHLREHRASRGGQE